MDNILRSNIIDKINKSECEIAPLNPSITILFEYTIEFNYDSTFVCCRVCCEFMVGITNNN